MNMLSKNNRIANRVISMILGILAGLVLVLIGAFIKAETLVWLALVIWGIIIIVSLVPVLIYSIANVKNKGIVFDLIVSIVGILLGVGLIISHNNVVTVILAAYMIIFPIIRTILARGNWAEQLKRELLRIILGVVLLVFGSTLLAIGFDILNLLLKIVGWVIIALTVVLGLIEILHIAMEKPASKTGEPIYVEHTEE